MVCRIRYASAILALAAILSTGIGAQPPRTSVTKPDRLKYETITLRGRVVWMADALRRRFGVNSAPEAANRILAIETAQGTLHPIVEDLRGRSFRKDPRLMKMDVELLARRHHGSPMVQIIRVYQIKKDGKYELDYWCDICAITMYELKPCDCCQGKIELRLRRMEENRAKK